jgi:hypothetical protein
MQVVKDVRILGYFSKPKVFREQEGLGNTGLDLTYSVKRQPLVGQGHLII